MTDIKQIIKPGKKITIFYGPGNLNNMTIHIRGIVDDHVIFRKWNKLKQYWDYSAEPWIFFELREGKIK